MCVYVCCVGPLVFFLCALDINLCVVFGGVWIVVCGCLFEMFDCFFCFVLFVLSLLSLSLLRLCVLFVFLLFLMCLCFCLVSGSVLCLFVLFSRNVDCISWNPTMRAVTVCLVVGLLCACLFVFVCCMGVASCVWCVDAVFNCFVLFVVLAPFGVCCFDLRWFLCVVFWCLDVCRVCLFCFPQRVLHRVEPKDVFVG